MAIIRAVQSTARPKAQRKTRSPSHSWYIEQKPWIVTPFCLAPVLAGDTLKNLLWQARAVTQPVKNPLIGWHMEYMWFYYGFSAFDAAEDLKTLMLDPNATASSLGLDTALTLAISGYYGQAGQVDWLRHLLPRIVEDYFRDEGEAASDFQQTTFQYYAQFKSPGWTQSLFDSAAVETPSVPEIVVGADDKFTALELEALQRQWEFQRLNNLTPMTYEDWLVSQGVRPQAAPDETRELLRHTRTWAYPANTIDPANGTPRSAVSWSISERADKDRFFKEPGFIVGVSIARPKVYWDRQTAPAASVMNDPYKWLPLVLNEDVAHRIIKRAPAGLLDAAPASGSVTFDIGDLLMYGDQFLNGAFASNAHTYGGTWGANLVDGALSDGPGKFLKYPTATDIQAMFSSTTATSIFQDGVADFTIQSRVLDVTP